MSIYKGTQLISGVVTPTEPTRNLGQKIESDFQLVDAGLHKPDGSLINGSGIYAPFVQAIALLSESSPESFCTEQEWQASVTAHGMCGKYVYDSTNNTVRLPKRSSAHGNLIDSHSSGTNWYRVYSDGWCEQGAYYTGDVDGWNTINFFKGYISMPNISVSRIGPAGDDSAVADRRFSMIRDITNSSFSCWGVWAGYKCSWQACGYIDVSTYQQKPLYEYIVIATKIKSETEVDFDNLATELQNKVDKASLVETPAIIETYHNGLSWYRVYSDGWCEQGGGIQELASSVTVDVFFLKEFADTNYYINVSDGIVNSSWAGGEANNYMDYLTSTKFTFKSGYGRTCNFRWRACGYIS